MEYSPNHWQVLHSELRDGLIREIFLTRELLSNLRQEEVSLIVHDIGSLNQVLNLRSQMLEKLSSLRLDRIKTTEKIQKIASLDHKNPTLEQILPPNEEISTEILSLSDQLVSLTERMNLQQTQNQHLAAHPERIPCPVLDMTVQNRAKKKASVATINIKK